MWKKLRKRLSEFFWGKDYAFTCPRNVDEWNLYKLFMAYGGWVDEIIRSKGLIHDRYPEMFKQLPGFWPENVEALFLAMRADPKKRAAVAPLLQEMVDECLEYEPVPETFDNIGPTKIEVL